MISAVPSVPAASTTMAAVTAPTGTWLPCGIVAAEDDPPQIAADALDQPHVGAGEQLRAVVDGIGQIGRMDRGLGAGIATAHAVAALRAGRLRNAGRVGLVLEGDMQRRALDMMAEGGAGPLERGEFHRFGCCRERLRGQHLAGAVIADIEAVIDPDFLGPGLVLEHHGIRGQADGGVDQRGAAETAADERVDVLADAKVEEGVGRDRCGGRRC